MKPIKDPKTIQAEKFIKQLFKRDRMNESGPIKGTGARPDMEKQAGLRDMLSAAKGGTGRFRDRLTAGGRAMGAAMSSESDKPKKKGGGLLEKAKGGTGRFRDRLTAGGRAMGAAMSDSGDRPKKKKDKVPAPINPGGKGLDSSIAGVFDVKRGKKPPMPAPKSSGGADKSLSGGGLKNKSKMKFN